MKQVLQYQRCSYYDIGRNRFEFIMCAFVYNIRRLVTLTTWSTSKTKNSGNFESSTWLPSGKLCQWTNIFIKWFWIISKTYCEQIILQKKLDITKSKNKNWIFQKSLIINKNSSVWKECAGWLFRAWVGKLDHLKLSLGSF